MKLKVQVSPEGSTYVAAIDPESGEHRKAATLNPGQEFEIDIPGATSVDDVAFSDIVDSAAEQPGGGNEGSSQGGETEEPPAGGGEQPPAGGDQGDQSGAPAGSGDGESGEGGGTTSQTSEASEKPLYLVSGEEVPNGFEPSGLETPGGETLYHYVDDVAGESAKGNVDAVSVYADADDNEKPVKPAAPAEGEAQTS